MSKLDELLDLTKKLEAKTDDLEDLAEKSDDSGDADSSAKEKASGWAIAGRIAVCCMIAADIYYLDKKFD